MATLKWIKLTVEFFSDERIRIIEKHRNGERYLLLWIRLLCLAGKLNQGGYFFLDGAPMTLETLSYALGKKKQFVSNGLAVLQQNGIIGQENGMFFIPNWEKHQSVDRLERIRENDRLRKRKAAEKRKESSMEFPEQFPTQNKNKSKNNNNYNINTTTQPEENNSLFPQTKEPTSCPISPEKTGVPYNDPLWAQPDSLEQILEAYCTTLKEEEAEKTRPYLQLWFSNLKAKGKIPSAPSLALTLDKLQSMAQLSKMSLSQYLKEVIARGWHNFYPIPAYQQKGTTTAPKKPKKETSYNIALLEELI